MGVNYFESPNGKGPGIGEEHYSQFSGLAEAPPVQHEIPTHPISKKQKDALKRVDKLSRFYHILCANRVGSIGGGFDCRTTNLNLHQKLGIEQIKRAAIHGDLRVLEGGGHIIIIPIPPVHPIPHGISGMGDTTSASVQAFACQPLSADIQFYQGLAKIRSGQHAKDAAAYARQLQTQYEQCMVGQAPPTRLPYAKGGGTPPPTATPPGGWGGGLPLQPTPTPAPTSGFPWGWVLGGIALIAVGAVVIKKTRSKGA